MCNIRHNFCLKSVYFLQSKINLCDVCLRASHLLTTRKGSASWGMNGKPQLMWMVFTSQHAYWTGICPWLNQWSFVIHLHIISSNITLDKLYCCHFLYLSVLRVYGFLDCFEKTILVDCSEHQQISNFGFFVQQYSQTHTFQHQAGMPFLFLSFSLPHPSSHPLFLFVCFCFGGVFFYVLFPVFCRCSSNVMPLSNPMPDCMLVCVTADLD